MNELPLREVKKRLGKNLPDAQTEELLKLALQRTGLPLKPTYTPEEVLSMSSVMLDHLITEINQFDFSQIDLEVPDK
ncbi:MAG TPA: hypothetical protein V6C82_09320 [Chroococcales cyanobacterium]|jgi:hypothetical protein